MKKYIIIILLLILLTGCTNEINYNFNDKNIESTITSEFTLDEFKNYYINTNPEFTEDYSKNELKELLIEYKNNLLIPAYNDDVNTRYTESSFEEGDEYLIKYNYSFNYSNFETNYYFKNCFETFSYYEDDVNYYYQLTGKALCNYEDTLFTVTSDKIVSDSNEDTLNNGKYTWILKEEDNNIKFAISKSDFSITKLFNTIYIIVGVVLFTLIIITMVLFKLYKEKDN